MNAIHRSTPIPWWKGVCRRVYAYAVLPVTVLWIGLALNAQDAESRRTALPGGQLAERRSGRAVLHDGIPVSNQRAVPPRPVRKQLSDAGEPEEVELQHGMPRLQVLHRLGDPPMESLIDVLHRSRATLADGTELLFEHDSLIAVKPAQPAQATDDGRLSFTLDRTTVIYDEALLLENLQSLPEGDERLAVEDSFYFAESVEGNDGFDVHFTPSTPVCLLNDCPGCDLCQGADWGGTGGIGCCDDPSCHGSCGGGFYHSTWQLFKFSADTLFLSRLGNDFTDTLQNGGTTVRTEELTHGLRYGVKSSLAIHLYGGQHVEFGYLGGFNWSADGSSADLLPADPDTLAWNGTYDAKLDDYQINYVHRPWDSRWSLLCGVRYSEHEDRFTSEFPNQNLFLNGRTENRLTGIHVGTSAEWNCGPVLLFAGVKGGVFNNETRQSGPQFTGTIDLNANPLPLSTFTRDGEEISFLGDAEFTVLYPITDQALVRVGYQGLIFSDMVQVRKQSGTAADGSPLHYHGIFAGVEIRQ